jgi:hypothetical protein
VVATTWGLRAGDFGVTLFDASSARKTSGTAVAKSIKVASGSKVGEISYVMMPQSNSIILSDRSTS